MNEKIVLIYTGGGYGGFLDGIPARNLNEQEVKQYGGDKFLTETGLYEKPATSNEQLATKKEK